jgi:PAS domain S-box-containing protein
MMNPSDVFQQWVNTALASVLPGSTLPDNPDLSRLQQQTEFLWTVLNNSHHANIACLDRDYRYLFFNHVHQQSMKMAWNAEIEFGQKILDYVTDQQDYVYVQDKFDRTLAGETVIDVRAYGDDSLNRSFYEFVFTPMKNDQQEVIGLTIYATDVTHTKMAAESLKQAHDELEKRVAERTAELQRTNEKLLKQIAERGQFEQAVRESEERFRSTFEQSSTAVALTDQTLCIQYVNLAFCQLTGYEIEELTGQSLQKLLGIPEAEMDPFWQQSPLDSGRVWQMETTVERKDGRSNDVSMSVTAVYDSNDNLLEYVVHLQNVSLRRHLERAQQQFITNTSHELRTPLTNMRLYLQLLEKRPENQAKYLRVLDREVGRLQTLLGDIMEITALTASGGATSWQSVSPALILESAVNPYRRLAAAKDVRLTMLPVEEGLPPVSGDPARLTQAMGELVENALNFTPAGGRVVAGVGTVEKDGRSWISLSVRDSGPGIPADEQPYVFERFFRGAMSESGSIPGTGLGLSIAQAIVKAHGGRMIVESLIGKGSAFTILIPNSR